MRFCALDIIPSLASAFPNNNLLSYRINHRMLILFLFCTGESIETIYFYSLCFKLY